MKRSVLAAVLFALVLAACSGGGDTGAASMDGGEAQSSTVAVEDAAAVDEPHGLSAGRAAVSGSGGDAAADDSGQEAPADSDAPDIEPLPDAPPVRSGDRIIKEGTITVEVEQDGFDQAFTRVVSAARRYGGDVVGSSTRTNDRGDTFGSITVRVPVRNFEDLVVGVGEIGTIRDRDIDSQDVTAEFTDLESRLRHLRAQERFYLGLLDRAESVGDAISVQQQLDGIQSQIEQIQGRRNLLDDRTSFSTLTVELFEPGAGSLTLRDEPSDRPTLAHYWDVARDAFINVIGAMLVAGLFALPLLIALGALWLLYRTLVRPAPRRARTPRTPDEPERETVGADQ